MKLGRLKKKDSRDHDHLLRAGKGNKWKKTWRLAKVTNQKEEPHCVGHAWYGWFGADPIRQRPIQPSGIYTLAQRYDDFPGENYEGTTIRGAAKVLEITGHIKSYKWAFDIDTTVAYMLSKGPVVAGTNWYSGMMSTRSGQIKVTGSNEGGHAYLLYGVDTRKGIFRLRNSWGKRWGEDGDAWITFEDFERLIDEDGEICAAVESKVL